MTPTIPGLEGAFVPDPEDWPAPSVGGQSPEAVQNEPDDLASALPPAEAVPTDADEADVIAQRQDVGADDDDPHLG